MSSPIHWKIGRPIVWDATCVDTLATSYFPMTEMAADNAAASVDALKRRKYEILRNSYIFAPFVETLGPWDQLARSSAVGKAKYRSSQIKQLYS